MLTNAYLLAKIGADTAENEQHFAENLPKIGRRRRWCSSPGRAGDERAQDKELDNLLLRVGEDAGLVQGVRDEQNLLATFGNILQIFGGLVFGCIETKLFS